MTSLFVEYLLPRCILNLLTNSKLIQIEKSEKNYLIIMRPFRLSKLFSAIIIENEEEVVSSECMGKTFQAATTNT